MVDKVKFVDLEVAGECVHTNSVVIDSRKIGAYGEVTRRRRQCEYCGQRFTTLEKRTGK